MKARSLMHPPRCTLPDTMGVGVAARLLAGRHESAAPVVDDSGQLIGIALRVELESAVLAARGLISSHGPAVADVMRTPVVSLTPGAEESTVAAMLTDAREPFVTVVDGAALVGIIGRTDLRHPGADS